MGILETRKNRILLLIEQFKLGLKVQEGVEEIIKKSAVFYPELGFLDSLANKTSQGVALEDNLRDQISKEKSNNVKSFLEALTAKELA
ncbi:hypothetical protein KY308_03620, partial [Candidatus Woesearchaeota archaeon]|nr:hypothetical protein [Candidatus Woesearchaeota archaeon]